MASFRTGTGPKKSRRLVALALGLGLASAALGTASPASAKSTAEIPARTAAGYVGTAEKAGSKAFFDAVLKSVAKRQADQPSLKVVTVYYNASQAPSFRSQISSSASIWNSSVSNVKLQATSGTGDFAYYEGNTRAARTPPPTATAAATSSWTTRRTGSTTPSASPPTRPAMCWACRTTTAARAAS